MPSAHTSEDVPAITIVQWLGRTILDTTLSMDTRMTAVHSTRLHIDMLMEYGELEVGYEPWECVEGWISATIRHPDRLLGKSELIEYGILIGDLV